MGAPYCWHHPIRRSFVKDGKLEFKDAPVFGRVMRDPEICKGVLERILGFAIDHVEYLNTEDALDPATDAKGVRLDVFAKGAGRVYDVEMQIAYDPTLGRRMRYYQASIDQACLGKGDHYDLLPESYVVFICLTDAYGRGLPVYHLERRCDEDATVRIADDSHWLVLNASAWEADADPLRGRLLQYVYGSESAEDALIDQIADAVREVNADAAWRERAMGFMTVEHSRRAREHGFRRLGQEEGLKEGMKQGLEQGEERFAALTDKLLDEGRVEDLKRAANDPSFRDALFSEFHIA